MESARTVLTFVSGLVLGGVAIWLTPTVSDPNLPTVPGGPPPAPVPGSPGAVTGLMPLTPLPAPTLGDGPPQGASSGSFPPVPGSPTGGPVQSMPALDAHLATAADRWTRLARTSATAQDPALQAFAPAFEQMATRVPVASDRYPPLQQVVAWMVEERQLVDRFRAAGGDAGEIGQDVDTVLSMETPAATEPRSRPPPPPTPAEAPR